MNGPILSQVSEAIKGAKQPYHLDFLVLHRFSDAKEIK
jgi:hypothetical protein